jgi:hypothetical protein
LLPSNAFWPEECRSNLLEDDTKLPREPNRTKYTSIYQQHGHNHKKRRVRDHWLARNLDNLNRYKLKLNPTKCYFGVQAGQLLGFLVSARGIEANPEKIQAILTVGKPTKLHQVQQLAGRVAALSRFIAWLGEKALPFYALMKKSRQGICASETSAFHATSHGRTQ